MGPSSLFQCLNYLFPCNALDKGRVSLDHEGLESGGSLLYEEKSDSVGEKRRKALA